MGIARYRERRKFGPTRPGGSGQSIGHYYTYVNGQQSGAPVVQTLGTVPQPSLYIEKCWDSTNSGPPYRSGQSFSSLKIEFPRFGLKAVGSYNSKGNPALPPGSWEEYRGGFTDPVFQGDPRADINYINAGSSPSDQSVFPSMSPFTATAFSKTKPPLGEANLAQFLIEFRETPRMLKTTAKGFRDLWRSIGGDAKIPRQPKKYADQFLNVQFGWLPFVSDLIKLNKVWWDSQRFIAQRIRDNDQWVRRSRVLQQTESSVRLNRSLNHSGCWPSANFRMLNLCREMTVEGGTCKIFSETWQDSVLKVWAEGAFKYYRPEFDSSLADHGSTQAHLSRLLTIYGARINPAVLYKVTPWTWFIDWFTNLGDIIDQDNAIFNDGTIAKYLYVMHKQESIIRQVSFFNFYSGPLLLEWQRLVSSKQRSRADNPYGFGLTWEQLSPKQIAIIAALGLSRT